MNFLKISALSLLISVLGFGLFETLESAYVFAADVSDQVIVTLNVTAGISITSPSDTTMSQSLGVSANTAVATTTWNVKTNNAAGYYLTVAALTQPAMKSGSNIIDDYATTSMPSVWSVAAGLAKFGFSATGTDVNTSTWGTGNICEGATAHSISGTHKYYGFSNTATSVATRAATTTTYGVDTTICYAVEQDTFYIPSGTYTATITATATTL